MREECQPENILGVTLFTHSSWVLRKFETSEQLGHQGIFWARGTINLSLTPSGRAATNFMVILGCYSSSELHMTLWWHWLVKVRLDIDVPWITLLYPVCGRLSRHTSISLLRNSWLLRKNCCGELRPRIAFPLLGPHLIVVDGVSYRIKFVWLLILRHHRIIKIHRFLSFMVVSCADSLLSYSWQWIITTLWKILGLFHWVRFYIYLHLLLGLMKVIIFIVFLFRHL